MPAPRTTASTSEQPAFRWPLLAAALLIAADSVHETVLEYLTTSGARIGYGIGMAAAAGALALVVRLEEGHLRKARNALPHAEFRRHPPTAAGRLFRNPLSRWFGLLFVCLVGTEHALEIVALRPTIGPSMALTVIALAATAAAIHRGPLSPRAWTTATPDLPAVRNIALSRPVLDWGSTLVAWGIWIFACLVVATACFNLLERW